MLLGRAQTANAAPLPLDGGTMPALRACIAAVWAAKRSSAFSRVSENVLSATGLGFLLERH